MFFCSLVFLFFSAAVLPLSEAFQKAPLIFLTSVRSAVSSVCLPAAGFPVDLCCCCLQTLLERSVLLFLNPVVNELEAEIHNRRSEPCCCSMQSIRAVSQVGGRICCLSSATRCIFSLFLPSFTSKKQLQGQRPASQQTAEGFGKRVVNKQQIAGT